MTGFKVNMSTADKQVPSTDVFTLLTDVNELNAGDKIIIAAADYDVALSTTQNNNNRGPASITKNNDGTISYGADVQILTLERGTIEGTFAFNTGSGYLYAASSSSNHLKTKTELDANGSWLVTVDSDAVAKITAQGANTRNTIFYNNQNGSNLFSCYAESSNMKPVAIYYLDGEPDTTPRFTVSPTDEQSIGAEGDDIQFTVDAINGAVVTAVSSDTTWLNIDDTFNATVDANETAEARSATITFSAYGCDDVVVTVSQAAKPAEGATISATLSFADVANRKQFDSEHQIWEQNGIIFKNYKNDSNTNVANYYNPARVYKGSKVVIVPPGVGSQTQIVFDCYNASYAKALYDSIKIDTCLLSDDKVTVTFSGFSGLSNGTYIIDSLSGQVRLDSLTIYTIYNL
jgi:hypothetical protein